MESNIKPNINSCTGIGDFVWCVAKELDFQLTTSSAKYLCNKFFDSVFYKDKRWEQMSSKSRDYYLNSLRLFLKSFVAMELKIIVEKPTTKSHVNWLSNKYWIRGFVTYLDQDNLFRYLVCNVAVVEIRERPNFWPGDSVGDITVHHNFCPPEKDPDYCLNFSGMYFDKTKYKIPHLYGTFPGKMGFDSSPLAPFNWIFIGFAGILLQSTLNTKHPALSSDYNNNIVSDGF